MKRQMGYLEKYKEANQDKDIKALAMAISTKKDELTVLYDLLREKTFKATYDKKEEK